MMGDRPDAAELLALVRLTLERTLVPQLPAGSHFVARDVLAALAVALRELEAGAAGLAEERRALEGFYGAREAAADDRLAVQRLRRRLAAEIRAGAHDGGPEVHALLRRALAAHLRLLYPDALPPAPGAPRED